MKSRAFSLYLVVILAAWAAASSAAEQTPRLEPAKNWPAPMPLVDSYNPDNAFARIIRGEQTAPKVFEDEFVLAFMDRAPVEPGHVLVISKTSRARNLLEIEPEMLARMVAVVQRVGKAQVSELGALGFTIIQNNGAGQTVPHLHIHVIPRMTARPLVLGFDNRADPAALEALAAKLRTALK